MNDIATVFVIDDDDSVRRSMARLFKATGYRAESFASAAAFLEQLSCSVERGPACALVDVRMPEMSGFELFERLQTQCPDLPVIFITGHGDTAMAERAIRAGASDFLFKPIDGVLLMAAVEQALAESRARLIRGSE